MPLAALGVPQLERRGDSVTLFDSESDSPTGADSDSTGTSSFKVEPATGSEDSEHDRLIFNDDHRRPSSDVRRLTWSLPCSA
jgi:hypothetical protein